MFEVASHVDKPEALRRYFVDDCLSTAMKLAKVRKLLSTLIRIADVRSKPSAPPGWVLWCDKCTRNAELGIRVLVNDLMGTDPNAAFAALLELAKVDDTSVEFRIEVADEIEAMHTTSASGL